MIDLASLEQQYNLPTGWLAAIQGAENSDSKAVSPKGAVGRFQLMPDTAKAYGVSDPTNDDEAALGAAKMSADLAKQYNGDPVRMAAAYNWGSGNLARKGLDNAPPETKNYIKSILGKIGDALVPPAEAAEPAGKDLSGELFASEAPPPAVASLEGRDLSGELFAAPTSGDLPTGTKALLPETKDAAVNALDTAASGTKDVMQAVSPLVSLYKMFNGQPLSQDEKSYLDQDTLSGAVSPIYDVAKGLGKGALGALGTLFSPLSGANRAFVANPVQNETGIPAGITDAAMSLVEPLGLSKLAGLGKYLASAAKVAEAAPEVAQVAEAPATAAAEVVGARTPAAPSAPVQLPKTAGAITQDPNLQRFEADAFAGARGEGAQKAATEYRANLNDATNESIQKIGSAVPDGNPADSLNSAFNLIHANEQQASNTVASAYKQARDLSQGVTIDPKDMAQNLIPHLASVAEKSINEFGATPAALGQYKKLMDLVGGPKGPAPLTLPVWLDKGEDWRTATSMFMRNITNPADKNALGQLLGSYDKYMSGLAGRLPAQGNSADAINAFKEAVATRRDYAQRFEGSDLVQNVLGSRKDGINANNGKSIDDLAKQFLGASGGKSGMADNFNSLMRAAGDQAPIVKQHVQNAIAQRIYNGATQGTGLMPGGDAAAISPAKLKTQLENVFVKQRDLATSVYGPDVVSGAQNVIKQLGQITSRQPNVGNAPSSGYTIDRLAKASGVMKHVPLLKWIPQAFEAYKNAGYAKDAAIQFSGKIPAAASSIPLPAGVGAAASTVREGVQ